jgi:hypothetical protein
MPKINVSHEDARALGALATLMETDRGGVVNRLLSWANSAQDSPLSSARKGGDTVAVYAMYMRLRFEGILTPATGRLDITSVPWNGKVFSSPSAAGGAVIAHVNPARARGEKGRSITPPCNGWDFWQVMATGETIQSVRPKSPE